MSLKETALNNITKLVDRFDEQFISYKNQSYNETLTRRDFIDPFFKALGWDMDNENGYAEAYREVIHEDRVKISGYMKAPDYSFRLVGGKRLFFVEAKKPSVFVKGEILPAYQVRRYGWSAKLPISIITDFEEFSIYDCTKKPDPNDSASVARTNYFTFKEYVKEFDFLWDTFSKEKVLKGSFDKFIQGSKGKKGTATVDKEFLLSLDKWRTVLAKAISKDNKNLNEDEINFAVQQFIDRIIFLRIAEDRSVEPYGSLKETIGKENDTYKNLFRLFISADEKYNSGIFDFKKDKISEFLNIDDKVIKTIISELYYPESPYEFSVLSVEILGSAYEQFLGKQIRVSDSHRVTIEDKPEVRKAGGVYYTPQYIVEYIVNNTVGKLIENKSPKEISKIKIVDPACGSGSFLLGAYQCLLDFHKDYYSQNGKIKSSGKDTTLTPEGNLTTSEKKRILTNNIFGVDIDTNAVEVTKLSLLLKCMEGETDASIATQTKIWNERVLPNIDNNIKSGNSLIDTDFYDGALDFGDEKKVKPFNWQKSFPEVFEQGGFDSVIGNPPYVRQESLGLQKEYFQKKYKVFHSMADLYSYFIEKGMSLLNSNGIFGIIVANKWMRSSYGEPLRKWIKKNKYIKEIIDFGDLQVFQGATTYPCILICEVNSISQRIVVTNIKTLKFIKLEKYVEEHKTQIEINSLDDLGWNLASDSEQKLLQKLNNSSIPLIVYVNKKLFYGIKTALNEAFVIDEETKNKLVKEDKRSLEIVQPFLGGKDIKRFQTPESNKYLILFPKGFTNEKGKNPKNGWQWLTENYPALANHLKRFEVLGKKRQDKGDYWWELRACDYYQEFEKPKIMLPDIALKMQATFDTKNFYCVNTAYIIPVDDKFLLGVLNSNLIQYFYLSISSSIRGGYLRFIRQYLENIPIRTDEKFHSEIVNFVEQLLTLNKEKQNTKLQSKIEQIQSRIEYCEDKMNQALYKLYGLTEEEIRIVEETK